MRFIYSDHANENMIERRISRDLVEEAVLFPEKLINTIKGRKIAQKIFRNKLLRVVYKETEKVYIIVTVYFTKVGRY